MVKASQNKPQNRGEEKQRQGSSLFLSLYFGIPKEKPPAVQRLGVLVQSPSNTPKSIFVCCFVVMMDPLGRKMVNKKRETKSKANPVHHNERSQIGNEIRKR